MFVDRITAAVLCLLAGCTADQSPETLDQLGHFAAGSLIARDARQWVGPEEAVEHAMDFARAREELQHPGECGDGCRRDLAVWLLGAEAGANLAR